MPIAPKLATVAAGAASLLFTASAFAFDVPNSVPEPSTWALVGLAAVIGAAVARRRK